MRNIKEEKMIHAVIIDKPESRHFWDEISAGSFSFSLSVNAEKIQTCDIILISADFIADALPEVLAKARSASGLKSVPIAAVTYHGDCKNQEELCRLGFNDVLCLPMCKPLICKRVELLSETLPLSSDTGSISFNSLVNIKEDCGSGAFCVQADDFRNIYRFVLRILGRLGKNAQILLLTLSCHDANEGGEAKGYYMRILAHSVQMCLRRGDMSAVCGEDQIMVLLIGADDDGGHLVANRIVSSFYSNCDDDNFDINYDIREVNTNI